ncbi:MAG: hypothetical protein MUO62_05815 [Anaerolineales bacterium]|nr:hypothetical protein [Anaerolineales bacterium]
MYTNYDDHGGRFGDLSVWTQSPDYDVVSSYAALDSQSDDLPLILVHKAAAEDGDFLVDLRAFEPWPAVSVYQLAVADPEGLTTASLQVQGPLFDVLLPPSSITHLVIQKLE